MDDADEGAAFAAAVTRLWDEIVAALPEPSRAALLRIVDDPADDPAQAEGRLVDLRDLLFDELFTAGPAGRGLWEQLFGSTAWRHAGATAEVSPERYRTLLAGLRRRAVEARSGSAPPQPSPADPLPVWYHLHQQVRSRLAALPYRPANGEPPDLIRLPFEQDDVRVPEFQFDEAHRPHSVVRRVNQVLRADQDPWGVTCWWVDPDEGLGVPPVQLIGAEDARLLAMAAAVGAVDGLEY